MVDSRLIGPGSSPESLAAEYRCPRCRGVLTACGPDLVCSGEHSKGRFPIVDGVPILIDEESSVFRISDYTQHAISKQPQSGIQRFALRVLPSLDLNVSATRNAVLFRALLVERSHRPRILNIGGKHPRGALARLRTDADIVCVECDSIPGQAIDVVADPRALPFEDASFDGVIADGVLEHSVDSRQVADEIHRVLRVKGVVYADTPFMLPVHDGAYDFQRFSLLAHRRLFSRFSVVSTGISSGPGATLGYSIQALLLAAARGQRSRFAMKTLCRLGFFWLKYLDLAIAHRPGAMDGALGIFFIGERSEVAIADRDLLGEYVGNTPDLYATNP